MAKKAKVTTRDVAAKCGLSQTTVSMILSNKEGMHFSEDTIQKVKETAASMGYQYKKRPPKEENLAHNTVIVLVPSLSSQYYTTIVSTVSEYAAKLGLEISVGITLRERDREKHYMKLCEQSDFYGIICTYPPQATDAIHAFQKKYPFVLMSDYNQNLKVGIAELDSYLSGELIANHLIQLGHEKIAYMTTPLNPNEIPRIRRLEGLKGTYANAGFHEDAVHLFALTDYQWKNYCIGNRYYEAGRLLVKQYFKSGENVTAFVANNDMIAIGVMDELHANGYQIPEDFSVCGFDNTLAAAFYSISLTTIDHSIEYKGKDAMDMLRSQKNYLSGLSDKKKAPVMRVAYEPQLIVRKSTGRAKGR